MVSIDVSLSQERGEVIYIELRLSLAVLAPSPLSPSSEGKGILI